MCFNSDINGDILSDVHETNADEEGDDQTQKSAELLLSSPKEQGLNAGRPDDGTIVSTAKKKKKYRTVQSR